MKFWERIKQNLSDKDFKSGMYNGLDYDSSAIDSAEYDGQGNMLVQYKGGGKKYLFPCTPEEWEDFQKAPSKGTWMAYSARRYS